MKVYLLVATVVHAITAMMASWTKRAMIKKSPYANGKLLATAVIVLGFMVVHVLQFRFGPGVNEGYTSTLDDGTNVRDLARLQKDLFSDPKQVAFYILALVAIGAHVWLGWNKAVLKLEGLPKKLHPTALMIGHVMTAGVVVGFSTGPLYALYLHQK